ncbi:bifunctional UDP-3-O-[3-hydroxymyristoyl] N-acetylglucosamine deacetylase/3-hydroxyacyl-ACP dehydratase [Coraliomargarita sp. SDUM461003]|uniref:Multifunctional fusion protein n=1 Tax=Thalassobacterium maritimum TaxID=3041265 RepID=A0ABU1AR96_9BACT|nr:bifunctional UDP-3-O-[3-hydroxymyristoyl] N-acetylglucosamine deacetylase/3-hydroxyacyl-ACP dehydratase [Coraliomargarita sp. SDUM461003]MBT64736.1 3-hydroxyacyl-[acyl-carrier-protein] dehydratase FabZ [Puniceicoccaceae bacterium]MDQ8206616.1 bifunctional UDP-3-O-[3-hydroxymyristoyl] N-acetylglucosamine deacetylase/3-hydroxyacyl-ACP dehydratase [Coraliomargarita sp. SDUM461003]HBR92610.1 3-hydroxyacyl-[acyl-carrier-protein] dehydratase FabZ [Opitutae bacterium]|tara:strand:+ start:1433 stop:2773 length:1341 start_codon:yes stop_codon:yes gene_type:complete
MKQRTILREVSIKGKSLHTGEDVNLTLKPAPENTGVIFRRIDLFGKPELKPLIDLVDDLVRSTTIADGHAKVHTIEHVLSALSGCGVDNVVIEMDASEPPILDGSAKHFVNLIQQAEPVEQDAEREYFVLEEPVSVTRGNSSIIALPHDGFRITCTSADDRGIHTQHLSLDIDPETYIAQVAPARTFTIYEDIEELLKLGKIKGGSLDSAIVIKGDKILSKEPLRFKDEFVRHKMLDIIGDITLVGMPIKAHFVGVRPGHALNAELSKVLRKKLIEKIKGTKQRKEERKKKLVSVDSAETVMDIRRVLDILPHRYPFVMIDRVIEIVSEDELVALKNVTINEPYFQGHYPGRPVMPGVLQVEAMAQAAGVLLLRKLPVEQNKIAFFMSVDKVKFRQAVEPGDSIEIRVKLIKIRGNKIATAKGECTVGGKVVSSAELMFMLADATD